MKTIKGPAIFLAPFLAENAPFNSLEGLAEWVAGFGYEGVQIPTWDHRIFDLATAATSQTYCDDMSGMLAEHGLAITELSTHLQGHLVATHPAYDRLLDNFAAPEVKGNYQARQAWAVEQLTLAAKASGNLGLKTHATFSGSLAWPYTYPFPRRPAGMVEAAFDELARRWLPILHAFDEAGVDVCYEVHPAQDLHDGGTFERFLDVTKNHPRANILYDPSHFLLQHLDYVQFIDLYHERIKAFHVKDAEYRPNGRTGVYGGYESWLDRPGRFRSLGDGQIDFRSIFSKLTQYGYSGWAVLEWECVLKDSVDGAREGAPFIRDHIIPVVQRPFGLDPAAPDHERNLKILGLAE